MASGATSRCGRVADHDEGSGFVFPAVEHPPVGGLVLLGDDLDLPEPAQPARIEPAIRLLVEEVALGETMTRYRSVSAVDGLHTPSRELHGCIEQHLAEIDTACRSRLGMAPSVTSIAVSISDSCERLHAVAELRHVRRSTSPIRASEGRQSRSAWGATGAEGGLRVGRQLLAVPRVSSAFESDDLDHLRPDHPGGRRSHVGAFRPARWRRTADERPRSSEMRTPVRRGVERPDGVEAEVDALDDRRRWQLGCLMICPWARWRRRTAARLRCVLGGDGPHLVARTKS